MEFDVYGSILAIIGAHLPTRLSGAARELREAAQDAHAGGAPASGMASALDDVRGCVYASDGLEDESWFVVSGKALTVYEALRNLINMAIAGEAETDAGRDAEVVRQIEEFGGFSVFWATDNSRWANAVDRLQRLGKIKSTGGSYPWCEYVVI